MGKLSRQSSNVAESVSQTVSAMVLQPLCWGRLLAEKGRQRWQGRLDADAPEKLQSAFDVDLPVGDISSLPSSIHAEVTLSEDLPAQEDDFVPELPSLPSTPTQVPAAESRRRKSSILAIASMLNDMLRASPPPAPSI